MRALGLSLLSITLLLAWPAYATDSNVERIIGILAVPSVFSYTEEVTETPTLNVLDAPNAAANVIATVSGETTTSPLADDLYLAEVAYEENGFEVVEQKDHWFRVLLRRASSNTEVVTGWVLPPKDAEYTELTEFLQNSLLEFTPAWDGQLYLSPVSADKVSFNPLDKDGERVIGVDISTASFINGQVWVRVHLRHICVDEEPDQYGGGWVQLPADWRTLFTHYSRGC